MDYWLILCGFLLRLTAAVEVTFSTIAVLARNLVRCRVLTLYIRAEVQYEEDLGRSVKDRFLINVLILDTLL
ncbi:hypothetical protein Baya_3365 [Bagarius yarrelli]|uniref:HAT C-terminal dimerisation domain-containing protein n=1 Tax=Bagarius yarrelli TaxID=175774 RepID=A0A556TSF5_BAGYA|nr:hypothetical protein Baya_3365 [Bagarius yarrelli]